MLADVRLWVLVAGYLDSIDVKTLFSIIPAREVRPEGAEGGHASTHHECGYEVRVR